MTTSHLQEQLDHLRQLANEDATHTRDGSLVEGVNLAVERFEVSHPTMAGTLRSIMNSLSSMGI